MPLAKWTTEWFNIYIYFLLHLGKKTICAQLLDKENYSLKGNIKEKKFKLLENVLKTELCIFHLVLKVGSLKKLECITFT